MPEPVYRCLHPVLTSPLCFYVFLHQYLEFKYLNFYVFLYCDPRVRIAVGGNHGASFLSSAEHVLFACLTKEPTNAVRAVSDAGTLETPAPAGVEDHGRVGSDRCVAAGFSQGFFCAESDLSRRKYVYIHSFGQWFRCDDVRIGRFRQRLFNVPSLCRAERGDEVPVDTG